MFKNNKELPLLSYFILKVNISAVEKWMTNRQKIRAIPEKSWKGSESKEYQITLLPTDPFTFYHNQANEFSPSIGGIDFIDQETISPIEWDWNKSFFYVNVSDPRITIFAVPIDEIFHLLRTGSNQSKQPLKDEEVISLGEGENFDEIYRNRTFQFSLRYSNELAALDVVRASPGDLVNY